MSLKTKAAAWAHTISWTSPAGWLASFAAAALHTWILFAIPYNIATIIWLFPLLVLIPGAITMIAVRGAWRRWYRWAALFGLTMTTYGEFLPLVLLIGGTWALHQSWVTDKSTTVVAAGQATPPLGKAKLISGESKMS